MVFFSLRSRNEERRGRRQLCMDFCKIVPPRARAFVSLQKADRTYNREAPNGGMPAQMRRWHMVNLALNRAEEVVDHVGRAAPGLAQIVAARR
jgi:hypothetical protein